MLELIINDKRYSEPETIGDMLLKEKVEFYIEQRNKILQKNKVNIERFNFYESRLIKDDWQAWWIHYTQKYLNTVIWLLKRLTKDISADQEKKLLKQFYSKQSLTIRKIGMYGMDNLYKDAELIEYFANNCKEK